jgi:hypothetical protein
VPLVHVKASVDEGALFRNGGADSVNFVKDVYPIGNGLLVGYSMTRFRLKKPNVCLEGVAVRPMMKASKYSST